MQNQLALYFISNEENEYRNVIYGNENNFENTFSKIIKIKNTKNKFNIKKHNMKENENKQK